MRMKSALPRYSALQALCPVLCVSSNSFLIDDQMVWDRNSCSSPNRKPSDRVLVIERPWWDDCDERKGGASEANIEGELDILQEVADEEGNGLSGVSVCQLLRLG